MAQSPPPANRTGAGRFEGKIGRTLADSEAWFQEAPHPGEQSPNVVVVLLDDTGFAQFGCYGSTIDTPSVVGEATTELYMRMISSVGASVGYDHGSAVSPRYRSPFPFAGTLHEVEIVVAQAQARGAAGAQAQAEMSRQ